MRRRHAIRRRRLGSSHNRNTHGLGALARSGLAEGERVALNARIEERDLERVLCDGATLPDELIQPLLGRCTVALDVDVAAVRPAWLESEPIFCGCIRNDK